MREKNNVEKKESGEEEEKNKEKEERGVRNSTSKESSLSTCTIQTRQGKTIFQILRDL